MNLRKRGNAAAGAAESEPPKAPVKKRTAGNGKAAKTVKEEEQENVEPVATTESEYFKDNTAQDTVVAKKAENLDDSEQDDEEPIKMKKSKKKSPLKGKAFQKKPEPAKTVSKPKKGAKKKTPAAAESTGPILSVEDAIENMLKMEMMGGAKSSKDGADDNAMMSDEDDEDSESDEDSGSEEEDGGKKANKRRQDDDGDDDFEEVEMADHASLVPKITKESLQITVDTKKSKKQVDKAAQLERMRKAILKKYRIIVHKLHLHCWLAHGFYLNRLCLSDMIRAVVLSVQTLQFGFDFKLANLDATVLINILESARSTFGLDAKSKQLEASQAVVSSQSLMKAVQELRCGSYLEYLLVVLVILRNMNIKTRLCVCFDVSSLKDEPTSSRTKTASANAKGGPKKAVSKKSRSKKQQQDELTSSSEEDDDNEPKSVTSKKTVTAAKPKMSRNSSKAALEKLKKQESSESEDVASDERDFRDIKKKKRASLTAASKVVPTKKAKKEADEDDDEFKPDIEETLSDDEAVEAKAKARSNGKVKKEEAMEVEQDPNNNVVESKDVVKKLVKPPVKDYKILSTDEDTSFSVPKATSSQDRCYWLEVYLESDKRWVCVEPLSMVVDDPAYFEKRFNDQVLYACAFDENNRLKDVTKRYSSNFLTTGRLLHISHIEDKKLFWETILFKYLPLDAELDMQEEKELKQMLLDRGLPSGLSEFKNHPLYILKRHLLKFQSIYPQHPTPVGHFREEPVYSRDNLVTLHSRQTWLKFARVIKPGQDAYKIVKGRLKASEYKAGRRDNPDLELYGFWQTKQYEPPRAYGGKVPRNEFGNVELFLPNMLPRGCVHLRFPNLNRVCRKLNIDCVAAVVGFDAHGGFSHAVIDGWVVCEEFKETVVAAAEEKERRANLKLIQAREDKILNNWKRLFRGVQIREKLRLKYGSFNSKGGQEPQKATKASNKPQQEASAAEDRQEEYPLEDFKSKNTLAMQVDDEDDELCDNVKISKKLAKSKPAPKRQAMAKSKKPAKKQQQPSDDATTEHHYPKRKTRNRKPVLDEDDDEEVEVENDDDRDKNFSGSEEEDVESEEEDEPDFEDDEDFDAKKNQKRTIRQSKLRLKKAAPKRPMKLDFDVQGDSGPAEVNGQPPSNRPVNDHDDDLNLSEEDDE